MTGPTARELRRRPPRRRLLLRTAAVLAGAIVLLAVGISVGESLHDNPRPGTETRERTLIPAALPPAAVTTVTVTVTTPAP